MKKTKPPEPPPPIPTELAAALATHSQAHQRFEALSPSCRREYARYVAEARTEETRRTRAARCIERIVASKRGSR